MESEDEHTVWVPFFGQNENTFTVVIVEMDGCSLFDMKYQRRYSWRVRDNEASSSNSITVRTPFEKGRPLFLSNSQ